MVKTFTRLEEDGSYTITNCCAVAGLGGDSKRYRDGSFEYYISEPIIENDPKSVGSFILAAIDNGNFGCSTEENTKDVYPLGQRQTRSFRRGTLPETRKRCSFLLVRRNRLAIA